MTDDIKKKAQDWEQSNLCYEDVRGDVERQLIGFIPDKDWNRVLDKISSDFIEFTKAWIHEAYLAGAKERDQQLAVKCACWFVEHQAEIVTPSKLWKQFKKEVFGELIR